MKIIENNWMDCKLVSYKGSDIFVPVWANWVCYDSNGLLGAFEEKPFKSPIIDDGFWFWEVIDYTSRILCVGRVDSGKDWKQSLEYVGE